MRAWVASVPLIFCAAGCGARERVNAECSWPDEQMVWRLDLGRSRDRRHLSDDALSAEDMAIRHADARRGHRSGEFKGINEYRRTRDSCMAALFDVIARQHGVTTADVRSGLGNRRVTMDALVMLSFAAAYILTASLVARRILNSALGEQPWLALAAIIAASIGVSVIGVLIGVVWSGLLETIRVGNAHLSYRVERIPWRQHTFELFLLGVALFWIMAAWRWRSEVPYKEIGRSGGNFSRL